MDSLASTVGCATELSEPEQQVAQAATQVPSTSRSFVGHYQVPTPASLASAATFSVPEVEWSVVGNTATLEYDLPVGLVGGDVSVTLSGTLAPGATSIQLTSGPSSGSCTAQGSIVTCGEDLGNLGAMPVSMAVVQSTASADGISPASRDVAVANRFGSDPIGTVTFDLSQPADDDDGGGVVVAVVTAAVAVVAVTAATGRD